MSEEKAKIIGYTKEKLYELLPAVYRQRDFELGKPLEDLIGIIAEQVSIIEKDIGCLYDDWFIETCGEWVTSILSDMVGARSLSASKSAINSTTPISQRAYVANTIAYRRRKGTVSILEQLARDVTQWNAKAVEFFKLLGTTQNINHLRLENHRTPDLRKTALLELLDTPFDTIAHTVEVRRIASGRGRYNIPNVGLFLWRLQAFPSIEALAFQIQGSNQKFLFNPFGFNAPLFNRPVTESEISHLAEEVNVPAPIRIRALHDDVDKYYGKEKSIFIKIKYSDEAKSREIASRDIEVCYLKNWDAPDWQPPTDGKVAIDPAEGKIALAKDADWVRVTYYYGFSSKMGGGLYTRPRDDLKDFAYEPAVYKISKTETSPFETIYTSVQDAIDAWNTKKEPNTVFEILDSENYGSTKIYLPLNCNAAIRAAQQQRPILGPISVGGETRSKLILDGLWMKEPSDDPIVQVEPGDMKSLVVRHCTLLPRRNSSPPSISAKASIQRRLCTWDNITGVENDDTKRLRDFLKQFASWITDGMMFKKGTSPAGEEYLQLKRDDDNLVKVTLKNSSSEGSTASLDVKKDKKTEENVYEFNILTENDKKNMYLEGGNDDLEVSLNKTISGRVLIRDSPVFVWDNVPGTDAAQLRDFLRSNFDLPWLSDAIDFTKAGNTLAASKDDDSLEITLKETRAVLTIKGNKAYEFIVKDDTVCVQSDASLAAQDSIIDAAKGNMAIIARSAKIENTTVFGKTEVDGLRLASNTIFTDAVTAKMTQEGCVRFSYIPPDSQTPQRYKCQPPELTGHPSVSPRFTSDNYGDPGYAQLHRTVAKEIFEGADNGAEMGAFNHLFQPQRIADLKGSLNEYLRFGLEAGVFLVT